MLLSRPLRLSIFIILIIIPILIIIHIVILICVHISISHLSRMANSPQEENSDLATQPNALIIGR